MTRSAFAMCPGYHSMSGRPAVMSRVVGLGGCAALHPAHAARRGTGGALSISSAQDVAHACEIMIVASEIFSPHFAELERSYAVATPRRG